LIAYQSLCLPQLEYASAAWDLTCKKDISGLEKMQVNAVRYKANIKIVRLDLPLIHTYRIVCRNSKYQPFLQKSELPVRHCSTVGSNTA